MTHHLKLGATLSLIAAFFYSCQTALVKIELLHLPPLPVVIFFQSFVALSLMLPLVFKNGLSSGIQIMTTKNLKLHILRACFSMSISFLLFYAVSFIPLVNGMLLANTAPLIVPFLAYFFLGQPINHRLWIPILIGYIGVGIVLHPTVSIFNAASLLALGAGVALASTMLSVRKLLATDSAETTAFYFFFLSTVISGLVAIYFWKPIGTHAMLVLIAIGLLYFLTQCLSTLALRFSNAQLVASLFYSNILYASVIAMLIWHNVPNLLTFVGMIFIIIGGILCIRIESKRQKLAQKRDLLHA